LIIGTGVESGDEHFYELFPPPNTSRRELVEPGKSGSIEVRREDVAIKHFVRAIGLHCSDEISYKVGGV
jgi:hypothetical protein